jgi:hypothetical protein
MAGPSTFSTWCARAALLGVSALVGALLTRFWEQLPEGWGRAVFMLLPLALAPAAVIVALVGRAHLKKHGTLRGTWAWRLGLITGLLGPVMWLYSVLSTVNFGHGRAVRRGARRVRAGSASAPGWSCWPAGEVEAEAAAVPPAAARGRLAAAWAEEAALEHASVAAFCRLAMQLLSAGAPADLVQASLRAASDEVEHARMAYDLASAWQGGPVGPVAEPELCDRRLLDSVDVAGLAVESLREGLYGEGLSAALAAAGAGRAVDPRVRELRARNARDEHQHAELGFQVIVWALVSVEADRVRRALADALASLARLAVKSSRASVHCAELDEDWLGRVGREDEARLAARVAAEVCERVGALLQPIGQLQISIRSEVPITAAPSPMSAYASHPGMVARVAATERQSI